MARWMKTAEISNGEKAGFSNKKTGLSAPLAVASGVPLLDEGVWAKISLLYLLAENDDVLNDTMPSSITDTVVIET
jgi:hypothetical protein